VNDGAVGPRVLELAGALLGAEHAEPMVDPIMGAEDFSYVLQRIPGAMAFLGGCPPGLDPSDAAANHSNRVVFDEDAMAHGVAVYAGFALDALADGPTDAPSDALADARTGAPTEVPSDELAGPPS